MATLAERGFRLAPDLWHLAGAFLGDCSEGVPPVPIPNTEGGCVGPLWRRAALRSQDCERGSQKCALHTLQATFCGGCGTCEGVRHVQNRGNTCSLAALTLFVYTGGQMSIDERLERLTERHEALTQSVELLVHQQREWVEKNLEWQAQAEQWQKNEVLMAHVLESVDSLARIALVHERWG